MTALLESPTPARLSSIRPPCGRLASRPGHQLIYYVGWELGKREKDAISVVPEAA